METIKISFNTNKSAKHGIIKAAVFGGLISLSYLFWPLVIFAVLLAVDITLASLQIKIEKRK